VPEVQVAVGLRREARGDSLVLAGVDLGPDAGADEVERLRGASRVALVFRGACVPTLALARHVIASPFLPVDSSTRRP
jgi:hypothetical protein